MKDYQRPKIVIAIPTIAERPGLADETAQKWRDQTCIPIEIHVTTYGDTWAAGLNDAWKNHPDADIFVCASDDMYPEDGYWLPCVQERLERGESPVPLMLDPRFTIYGGSINEVPDGTQTHMTNFPVLRREWLSSVFPLPEELHYFSDNLIADRLHGIGVPTVATLEFVIRHDADPRGRGAGMGDEPTRMAHDKQVYRDLRKSAV